jgi:hypothetical protein
MRRCIGGAARPARTLPYLSLTLHEFTALSTPSLLIARLPTLHSYSLHHMSSKSASASTPSCTQHPSYPPGYRPSGHSANHPYTYHPAAQPPAHRSNPSTRRPTKPTLPHNIRSTRAPPGSTGAHLVCALAISQLCRLLICCLLAVQRLDSSRSSLQPCPATTSIPLKKGSNQPPCSCASAPGGTAAQGNGIPATRLALILTPLAVPRLLIGRPPTAHVQGGSTFRLMFRTYWTIAA